MCPWVPALLLAALSPCVHPAAGPVAPGGSRGWVTIQLPVIPVETSGGAGATFHYPASVRIRVPPLLRRKLSAYGAAGLVWLGPRGWHSLASAGADGSATVALYPGEAARKRGRTSPIKATAAVPPWKTLRVSHFPTARRRLVFPWERNRKNAFPQPWRSTLSCTETGGRSNRPGLSELIRLAA